MQDIYLPPILTLCKEIVVCVITGLMNANCFEHLLLLYSAMFQLLCYVIFKGSVLNDQSVM